jgi:ubiquitin carboxyl-terminal hydrolase L3
MTPLAHDLGVSPQYQFHDVYSFEADCLTHVPRPVHALLVTLPITPTWRAERETEDHKVTEDYDGTDPKEPVLWFKQTIIEACGSIGLIHCVLNGPSEAAITDLIVPGSELNRIRSQAPSLRMAERANLLEESTVLEEAHAAAAQRGVTAPPEDEAAVRRLGNHFVAFVKGRDGRLWELEGSRKGPICRGVLGDGEDVLSPTALGLGIGRYVQMEERAGGSELRFSCIALSKMQ